METEREIDVGDIHDILRNDRRRAVLTALQSDGGEATIRDLSERIAALESNEDPPPRNVRQSVYVSLHQTHLPKLDELGIIDYDTDAKTVELRAKAEAVQDFMRNHGNSPIPWAKSYIGIAILGLIVVAGDIVGLVPANIDAGIAFGILFAAVLVLATYQSVSTSG